MMYQFSLSLGGGGHQKPGRHLFTNLPLNLMYTSTGVLEDHVELERYVHLDKYCKFKKKKK